MSGIRPLKGKKKRNRADVFHLLVLILRAEQVIGNIPKKIR
ncbi:unknown protein (plasmid) [Simkania negevensis Z]|uniref:Uncharacterized protein n=1 Tax=Simkania negevensis (strain ATCC VR-1471 / DSM 27360 / Z) TaxID=331113 RepID=F8L2S9_SIMNZ|nr:unknown protein [Simkania negevensis Z]